MRWRIKASVQASLGRLPARVGDPIYHALQHYSRGIPTELEGQRSFANEIASLYQGVRGKRLDGLRIVELGSGWYPVLPLLLVREFGGLEVHTFDVNRHYSATRIAAAAREIMGAVEPLRADPVLRETAATGKLPDTIHYYPRIEIQNIETLSGGLADLAMSRSVLEYISPASLRDIHRRSHGWMTPDALWIHLIGTSDDRARQDKQLHPFDFLRYSDKEWARISDNRYAYKNRLRLPQYRGLFQAAAWRVEHEEYSVTPSVISTLHRVPIHADFRHFSEQDLVAGAIRFVLSRENRE